MSILRYFLLLVTSALAVLATGDNLTTAASRNDSLCA